ncbi:MAG: hypothetical protein EBR46_01850 [Betaproteobacteria bacterium]|nr:hypothetical protein [Betaproteobacteria bacterium]
MRALKGHEVEAAALQFKSGDALYGTFACRSVDALVVLGSNGRAYSVAVSALPGGRGDGAPITTFIELESGTQPAHYLAGPGDTVLLLAGTGGFGLMARLSDLHSRQRAGKAFLSIEPGEQVLPPAQVLPSHDAVAALALDGRLLVFAREEMKLQPGGGRGLTLMDVDAKTPLVSVCTFSGALRVAGQGRGGKDKDEKLQGATLAQHAGKRARKGRKVEGFPRPMRVTPLV